MRLTTRAWGVREVGSADGLFTSCVQMADCWQGGGALAASPRTTQRSSMTPKPLSPRHTYCKYCCVFPLLVLI